MKPSLVSTLLLVSTLANSQAQRRHINKRADDQGPLEPVVTQLSADLAALTATVQALQAKLEVESGHSSFLAQFSALQATTPTSGPFRFDHVVFDDGSGYDPLLGVYTAPFTGVYVISAKFYTRGIQPSHPIIDFKLNGNILDRMGFDITAGTSGHEDSSHSSAFAVRLQAGDKVWLESIGGRAFNLYGRYHSYFSGALLSAQ